MEATLCAIGIDVPTTVARFGGNEILLIRFLRKFPTDSSFPEMELAMEAGNRSQLAEACHKLKGVSGNLGLAELYNASAKLMSVLRQSDTAEIDELFRQVRIQYDQVLTLLHGLNE